MLRQFVNPRQTVLVTCKHNVKNRITGEEQEKDNIIAIDWHMPLSFEPPMYAIAIGKTRFSCHMVQESGVFVVNFLPKRLEKQALFCGRNTGEHMDKFKEANLAREESDTVDCPRIKEALAYLECQVTNVIEAGDHLLFIGKVVRIAGSKTGKRLFHVSKDKFTTTVD